MATKTVIDEKGVYVVAGTATGVQQTYGGTVVKPEQVAAATTVSLTTSVLAYTGSGNVSFVLPSSPVDGQEFDIIKATAVAGTVSITGSNTAHTINGSASAVALLTAAGKSLVQFVGSPTNMWVTK